MDRSFCRLMSLYNANANTIVFDACRGLDHAALIKDRKAFFKSILGTLNHILVGDDIWMTRFEGGSIASTGLDAIHFEDLDELWEARKREDRRIAEFFANVEPAFFNGTIDYVNNSGKPCADSVSTVVVHFFNHQTHHRGQLHAMLTQADVVSPVLDLHRVVEL